MLFTIPFKFLSSLAHPTPHEKNIKLLLLLLSQHLWIVKQKFLTSTARSILKRKGLLGHCYQKKEDQSWGMESKSPTVWLSSKEYICHPRVLQAVLYMEWGDERCKTYWKDIDKGDWRRWSGASSGIGQGRSVRSYGLAVSSRLESACVYKERRLLGSVESGYSLFWINGNSQLEINPKFQQIYRNVSSLLSELVHSY